MDNLLMQEFTDKAAKVRIRDNAIATKLTNFLHNEIASGKKILAINAKDVGADKIHLQTLYTSLRKNGIEIARGKTFVVDNVNAKYVSRVVVKLA